MGYPLLSGNMLRELRYIGTNTKGGVMIYHWATSHSWVCRRKLVEMGYAEIIIEYSYGNWVVITQKGKDYLGRL